MQEVTHTLESVIRQFVEEETCKREEKEVKERESKKRSSSQDEKTVT